MIYHAYNRGAHKAPIFNEPEDYLRFQRLLYLGNSVKPLKASLCNENVFSIDREQTLVEILAYCLMPNHFHIVLADRIENGMTIFMRKVCTSYSMYYNFKYKHSGTLFQGSLKSKYVENDYYLNTLINYVHLNPFGIEEPDMAKEAKPDYMRDAYEYSRKYKYSSLKDYLNEDRPERIIVSRWHLEVAP